MINIYIYKSIANWKCRSNFLFSDELGHVSLSKQLFQLCFGVFCIKLDDEIVLGTIMIDHLKLLSI